MEYFGVSRKRNPYDRLLTEEEIRLGLHRDLVGGMWDELGRLQIEFLKRQGLRPTHSLLDVGCGALRGGVRFVEYLNSGLYCGLDMNESLLEVGRYELELAGLSEKHPVLLADDSFAVDRFGRHFDCAMAQSVFSHVPMNHIVQCLVKVRDVLKPGCEFFATFFEAPHPAFLGPLPHEPGGVTTYLDRDPFHYSLAEFEWMAKQAGMALRYIGDWEHPRNQKMLGFKSADMTRGAAVHL